MFRRNRKNLVAQLVELRGEVRLLGRIYFVHRQHGRLDQFVEPERAMAVMTGRHCRHLPVVADGGHVVGLVSIGDLVRWVSQHHECEIQVLSEYVCGKYPG